MARRKTSMQLNGISSFSYMILQDLTYDPTWLQVKLVGQLLGIQ